MTVVLGVGNPIMGDDATGLALLARVRARWAAGADAPAGPAGGPAGGLIPLSSDRRDAAPAAAALAEEEIRGVRFVDGGTAGMELLPVIQGARDLLLLDSLAGPGAPGEVVRLTGDQVPRLLRQKLSPHQVGLLDLLSAARLLGREPERVAVVGVVAASPELDLELSAEVAAALEPAAAAATGVLSSWT